MTTESSAEQIETIPVFRAPRAVEWQPLAANDGDEAKKKETISNRDELNNTLLTSLQMQHLVVLAGSGCSLSAGGPSMLDLWNSAVGEDPSAIANKVHHDLEDKNIEAFLSRIEAFLQVNVDNDNDVVAFLNECKRVILKECSEFLSLEKLSAHQTFLHRLSRRRVRDQRLKVFTTNYDTCFERAIGALGGVALDGFSFATPRRYNPRYFGYDIMRRPRSGNDIGNYLEGVFLLYKLHGSVNWARSEDGTVLQKEQPEPSEACLIYPANGKYQQSFTQPHLESLSQYFEALREPNTCVLVVGFGFNDDHLAEPLLSEAKSNPHLRLIIVDPGCQEKVAGGDRHWKELADLSSQGEDIWFIGAGFEEFSQMIPDLKSLTPADTLMKAVQGITKQQ